jgi:hypothetical protein
MLRAMSDVKREDEEAPQPSEETPPKDADGEETDEREESSEADEPPPVNRKPGRPAPAAPPSEDALNAPSRQTVGMLGVVAAATLIMWGAGRAACNYHEPGESLSPRAVALEARTRSPKDAALEFSHRWLTADFDIAAKLATGDVAAAVEKDRASCAGAACTARKNVAATALSVAEVVQGNPVESFVRVRTVGLPQGDAIKMYGVERVGPEWKVTREFDPSAPLPALKEAPSPPVSGAVPGGPGSELPSGAVTPLAPTPQRAAPKATAPAAAAPAPVAPSAPAQPKP